MAVDGALSRAARDHARASPVAQHGGRRRCRRDGGLMGQPSHRGGPSTPSRRVRVNAFAFFLLVARTGGRAIINACQPKEEPHDRLPSWSFVALLGSCWQRAPRSSPRSFPTPAVHRRGGRRRDACSELLHRPTVCDGTTDADRSVDELVPLLRRLCPTVFERLSWS
ncbi:MAG: hypothetical protein ACLT98_06940 [Eggerthellaceae bacterium]